RPRPAVERPPAARQGFVGCGLWPPVAALPEAPGGPAATRAGALPRPDAAGRVGRDLFPPHEWRARGGAGTQPGRPRRPAVAAGAPGDRERRPAPHHLRGARGGGGMTAPHGARLFLEPVLTMILLTSWVFWMLAAWSARRFLRRRPEPDSESLPAVSILKP